MLNSHIFFNILKGHHMICYIIHKKYKLNILLNLFLEMFLIFKHHKFNWQNIPELNYTFCNRVFFCFNMRRGFKKKRTEGED